MEYQPKEYFSKGRTLEWGKDLTPEQMKALRKGEVFTLLGEDGKPFQKILMDSYSQIRERNLRKPQPIDDNVIPDKKKVLKWWKRTKKLLKKEGVNHG